MGGDGKKYRRETKQGVKRLVSEIYSPPRVTKMLEKMPNSEVLPGFALDITTYDENGEPWDSRRAGMRNKAGKMLEETKPTILIGPPGCREFSTWQNQNNQRGDPELVKRKYAEAMVHMKFVRELYKANWVPAGISCTSTQ